MTRRGCVVVSGRLTSTPCCIRGAVTMKTISSTSITSTKGVTLISEKARRPRLLPTAIAKPSYSPRARRDAVAGLVQDGAGKAEAVYRGIDEMWKVDA